MMAPATTQLGTSQPRYEIRLDGTGAAHAIDHALKQVHYLLQPWSSDFELQLDAIRSLLPAPVVNGAPLDKRPTWLAELERTTRTLLLSEGAQASHFDEGSRLIRRTLGEHWTMKALPEGLSMTQVCDLLSQPKDSSPKVLDEG